VVIKNFQGSVSIKLQDYHALIDYAIVFKEKEEKFLLAAKELQVFLSYLSARADIEKYVDEFNRQSKTSKIVFDGTTAKIEMKDD